MSRFVADDETPKEHLAHYGKTTSFSSTNIRGKAFDIDLSITNGQLGVCQTIDGKCSTTVAWQSDKNRLFVGAFYYQGVTWFYDWVRVRKKASVEPVAVWKL